MLKFHETLIHLQFYSFPTFWFEIFHVQKLVQTGFHLKNCVAANDQLFGLPLRESFAFHTVFDALLYGNALGKHSNAPFVCYLHHRCMCCGCSMWSNIKL